MLHNPVVFRRRAHQLSALPQIVGTGLLYIDVLVGLAGPNGHQGMPVVRGGDRNRVNRLVLEQLAEISISLRLDPQLLDLGDALPQHVIIDVA